MTLTKSQVKYLKKLSHNIKSHHQIGKSGVGEKFIEQIEASLDKHELIKFNVLQNAMVTIDEAAEQIAQETHAEVVQVIGNTAIIYRQSSKEKNRVVSKALSDI